MDPRLRIEGGRVWWDGVELVCKHMPCAHEQPIRLAALSPGCQFLATYAADCDVRRWDLRCPAAPGLYVTSAAEKDFRGVLVNDNGTVFIWDYLFSLRVFSKKKHGVLLRTRGEYDPVPCRWDAIVGMSLSDGCLVIDTQGHRFRQAQDGSWQEI